VITNYREAAAKWSRAADRVGEFDRALDGYVASKGGGSRVLPEALVTLNENALRKSVHATGTLAGEAEELRYWRIHDPTIVGPGAAAGEDLFAYQPYGGGLGSRGTSEVKTARSAGAMRDGIANAYQAAPTEIYVRYDGPPFATRESFKRGTATYHTHGYQSIMGVKVTVIGPDGALIDRFSVLTE
jgi:hypothetical protein